MGLLRPSEPLTFYIPVVKTWQFYLAQNVKHASFRKSILKSENYSSLYFFLKKEKPF